MTRFQQCSPFVYFTDSPVLRRTQASNKWLCKYTSFPFANGSMDVIEPKHISQATVAEVLHSEAALLRLIDAMVDALTAYTAGGNDVVNPVRTVVPVSTAGGFLGCMPALCPYAGSEALGVKLVSFYPHNRPPVHTHNATILLFDPPTGQLLSIMDGTHITELRTAAVSAAASRALASPSAKVAAFLGSGVQARSHLRLHAQLFDFEQIRIWSRTPENAAAFATWCRTELALLSTEIVVCASAEDAVKGADIVNVCTASKEPVLKGDWVKRGAHVNAVGACRPDWRETDSTLMCGALVYVDSIEAAHKESGDIILSGCAIVGELGGVVKGANRHNPAQTTVFKSLGLAVEDVAAARLVLDLCS